LRRETVSELFFAGAAISIILGAMSTLSGVAVSRVLSGESVLEFIRTSQLPSHTTQADEYTFRVSFGTDRILAGWISSVLKFLVWCILLVLCWPLALLALVMYPLVWILLLPFRIVGIAVEGVLEVVRGIMMLPVRLLRGPRAP